MRPLSSSRRAGFTMLEAVIGAAVMAILVLLTLSALSSTAAPVTDATLRAELASRGQAALERLVVELQGALDVEVGYLEPDLDFVPDLGNDNRYPERAAVESGQLELDDDELLPEPEPQVFVGRAVRFRMVVGWDATSDAPVAAPGHVVWAFVRDEPANGVDDDRDGLLDELKLVRLIPRQVETAPVPRPIEVLPNVVRDDDPLPPASYLAPLPGELPTGLDLDRAAATPEQPPAPCFLLTRPATLEVRYEVQAVSGYVEGKPARPRGCYLPGREYAVVGFHKVVNLRNLNQ